jgi:hypothetical protein
MKPKKTTDSAASMNPELAHEFDEDADRGDPSPGHRWVDAASQLDDYLEEEVVDSNSKPVGTLSCYWEGPDRQLVFCGIKIEGEDAVRVVPGDDAQTSERYSWVQVAFPTAKVLKAPVFECDQELTSSFRSTIYKHFGIEKPKDHGALKYLSGQK